MLWSVLVVAPVWLGYEILNAFAPACFDLQCVLAGAVPCGFTIVSWVFLGIRFFTPLNWVIGLVISIMVIAICFILQGITCGKKEARKLGPRDMPFSLAMAFCSLLFFTVVDCSILRNGTTSSGTVFSDLPFHLGLITSFAYGGNSYQPGMITPFYAGESLSYPIIPDFFSAVLVGCGFASLRVAIAVPTFLLLLSVVVLVHKLASAFTSVRFVPEFAIFCFLYASGVGWKWLFIPECANDINANLAHCFCRDRFTFWIHPLIHFLMPQRSALFSMPIAIFITLILMHEVRVKLSDTQSLAIAGVLMGLLPMLSAHSFIGVGEYALFLAAITFPWTKPKKWITVIMFWSVFGIVAIFIALPQVLWLLRVKRQGFGTISPIWLETFPGSWKFGQLWWESLGPFVVIAIFVCWPLLNHFQLVCYLPSIGVFLVSNFIRYQPGAMDNNKVFYAGWYSLACCAVAHFIIAVWSRSRGDILVKVILIWTVIGFSLSSVVAIGKAIFYAFPMFNNDEKEMGQWVMENTLKDSVFLTNQWHANTVMSIGGRIIMLGYGGWVWTHGLDHEKRNRFIRDLARDIEAPEEFDRWKIRYVVTKSDDDAEKFYFPTPGPYSRWICVVDISNAKVYRMLHQV